MATFLSSRLKNLKVGIQGYTDSTEVASFIGNVNIDGSIKTTTFDDGSSTGLNNYVITADGSGGWSWQSISTVGAVTSPGGADGQIQYNNGGSIGGAAQLYYDDVNSRVGVGTATPGYLFEVDGDASFLGVIRDGDGDAGANGQILMSTGSGINWVNAAPASAITGLNIKEEGSLQGGANAVATLDFVGSYITATVVGSTATITMTESPDFTGLTVNSNTVWHEGNDGVGSGLDADKLDGQEGSYYLDYTNFTNVPTIGNGLITISTGSGLTGNGNFTVNQSGATTITVSHADTSTQTSVNNANGVVIQDITLDGFGHITTIGSVDLDGRYYTETEADARFLGINAKAADSELLDGQDSTYYLDTSATAQTKSGDLTLSSDLVVSGNVGIGTATPAEKLHVEGQAYISETVSIGTAIDIVPYNALNGGTLSFEGSAGQLFSVTNNLTSGSIFSVNDVSGIPSFNVDADGTVSIAAYGGDVGVGTEAPSEKLDVVGSVKASEQFISSVATGTAPLSVASATLVSNLNSDLLDGQQGSYYLNWNNVTNKPSPVVTVTLSGDVTGTANTTLTNLGNGTISIATTIAANSVALGTDTVGDYVEGISSGSGIVVGGTSGEGWTATISHADTSSQASVNNSNGNVIQDITLDGFGHITAIGSIDLDGRYLGLTAKAADSDLLDGQDGSYYLNTSTTFGGDVSGTYDAIVVANDSHTHDGRYYTETESDARFLRKDTSDTLNGNLTLTGELRGPATFVLDPAAVGDNTGTLVIRGNLQVDGVTTTINSTIVSIDDKNIVLASGAADAAAANGAGITIDGASATLTYAAGGDFWVFNKAPYYNSNRLLTTADEGSGNGLDADTLDGQEGSYYRNASNINAGTIANAYLPATISSDITGNAATATKLATSRTIALSGDVTGSVGFDGSANVTINATVVNDSHNHDGRYYTEAEADARFLGINAKAADSELLDGINSTSFLRSDANDTFTGVLDINGTVTIDCGNTTTGLSVRANSGASNTGRINLGFGNGGNNPKIQFDDVNNDMFWGIGAHDAPNNLYIWGNASSSLPSFETHTGGTTSSIQFEFTTGGNLNVHGSITAGNGNTVWHAGNDGSGSGLDADLLDGQQGSYYLNTSTAFGGDVSGTYNAIVVANDSHTHDTRYYTETESDARFLGINAKAADSDLLDGQDSTYYRNASNINAGTIGDAYLPATISSDITGNAATATKLATARTIGLSGDVTGSVSFDGSADVTITATVANDSHTHDSRYYTETESDARFLGINAKAADSELLDGINSTSFLRSDQDDTTTGKLTAKTLALTNDATDTSDHRIAVYDAANGISYGMMLWNSNGTSGDWSTMIYGPNQSARRISFGKVNTTSFINHASVTEIAYFDLDDSTLRLDADAYVGSNVVWNAGNDGAGSGLDADLLDGINSGSFLRSDADDTATGQILINNNQANPLELQRSSQVGIEFNDTSVGSRYLGVNSGVLRYGSNLNHGINSKIWHAGNDGSGSGLDADLLDGINSGSFLRSDADDTSTGTLTLSKNGNQLAFDRPDGAGQDWRFYQWASGLNIYPSTAASDVFFGRDGYTTYVDLWNGGLKVAGTLILNNSRQLSNVTYGGNTIWHAGNDGSGSGLDADLLDGYHQTSFLRIAANSNSPTNGTFAIGSASSRNFIQSHAGQPLDLNPLGNAVTINGTSNTVWHAGNDGSGSGLDADLLDGQQSTYYLNTSATTQTKSGGLNVSGNVGIGTTTPSARLHVADGSGIFIQDTGGTERTTQVLQSGNSFFVDVRDGANDGQLVIRGKGGGSASEYARFDTSGRLLIGTSSTPHTCKIQLYNGNAASPYIETGGTNRNANGLSKWLIFRHGYWGGSQEVASIGVETISSNAGSGHGYGAIVFHTGESGNGDSGSTSTERLRIDSSGNVGIGTTSPAFSNGSGLEIQRDGVSTLRIEDSSGLGAVLEIFADDGSRSAIYDSRGNSSNYGHEFRVNGSPKVNIDSSGNVGIGTTSPQGLLHLAASSQPSLYFEDTGSSNTLSRIYKAGSTLNINSRHTTAGQILFNSENSSGTVSERARIDSSGRLLVGTSSASNSAVGRIISRNDVDYSATEFEDNATLCLQNETNSNPAVLLFHSNDSGGSSGRSAIVGGNVKGANNRLGFYGNAQNLTTSTDPDVLIDSSGRLGVGTSTAYAKLQVNGDIRCSFVGDGSDFIGWGSPTSTAKFAYISATDEGSQDVGLSFNVTTNAGSSNIEAIRIDDLGNVGIGTTSPNYALDVVLGVGIQEGQAINWHNGTGSNSAQIYGDASDNLIFRNTSSNTERARIDSSGRLLVGTSSARSLNSNTQLLQVEAADGSGTGRIAIGTNNNDNATGAGIYLFRSRAGSLNGNTIVNDGDDLGSIYFHGADGTDIDSRAAQIRCKVDGTPGANDMPGRLEFSTTADGANTPTERMRIDNAGNVKLFTPTASFTNFKNLSNYLGIADNYAPGMMMRVPDLYTGEWAFYLAAAASVTDFVIADDNNERLRINSSGNVGIGTTSPQYKLEVNGSFAATTKSFVIPHPTKEGYRLRHGSLEGPENGVYIRGRSKDFIIELPEYWVKLIDADSITVNLTPVGKSQTLWVKDIKNNKVYVGSKCSEVHYFYTVFAERADVERLQTEINCSEVV